MNKIMLGVPCFGETREMALQALRSFLQPDVDVVAIDNGGSPDVKAALAEMSSSISIIRNERNVYVNPAWNQLAERFIASEAEILVLANADLEVAPGWAQSLSMRHDRARRSNELELWFGHFAQPVESARSLSDEISGADALWSGGSFFALPRDAVKIAFPIPPELLIWYGDNWIFVSLEEAGYHGVILHNMPCWPPAAGISTNHIRHEADAIIARDRTAWNERLETVCRSIGSRHRGI